MWIQKTGDADERVDIVFVAEGYTANQSEQFYADARQLTRDLFAADPSNSPYHEYQAYFNVQALFTASNDAGYGTTARPLDTAFDATATLADGRGIVGNGNAVRRFVNSQTTIGEQDIIVVLVNTDDYGGAAAGNVAWVTARHALSSEVLLHEMGHVFADLEDEYVDAEVAAMLPLLDGVLADSGHMSQSPTAVPWSAWLGFEDSLGVVGVYEGGYYRDTGVWRATPTSKMRDYAQPFSAPQKEAIVLAIDATVGSAAHLHQLTPFVYQATPIDPTKAVIEWSDRQGNAYDFGSDPMTTFGLSSKTLSLTVSDLTDLVRTGADALVDTITIDTDAILTEVYQLGDRLEEMIDRAIAFSEQADKVSLDSLTGSFLAFGQGNDVLSLGVGHKEVEIESLSDAVWLFSSVVDAGQQYLATGDLERVVFKDNQAFALNDPVVEQAYRLYQAAFSRAADEPGLGYWTAVLEQGATLGAVAQGFTQSAEFVSRYGEQTTTEAVVSAFYQNVLGRNPDAEGAAYWVGEMQAGRLQTHEVLAYFSESTENVQRLAPTLDEGVWFASWVG